MAGPKNVTGLKESVAALQRLGKNLEMRGIGVALRAGVEVLLPEAIARAPEEEGAYKDALEVRPPRKRRGTILAGIGLNKDKLYTSTGGRRPSNLPALLEYGHAIKHKRADGTVVDGGTVPARPHFRPTLEAHADDAIEAVRAALEEFVLATAEAQALRENRLRNSLAKAEAGLRWNSSRAAKWTAKGNAEKAKKYAEKAAKNEAKRERISRKLG